MPLPAPIQLSNNDEYDQHIPDVAVFVEISSNENETVAMLEAYIMFLFLHFPVII